MDYDSIRRMDEDSRQSYGPYQDLCYAVVAQACKDYRHALQALKRSKGRRKSDHHYIDAQYTIQECEYFFRNDLSLWCDLDGEWVISEIRKRAEGNDRKTDRSRDTDGT